MTEPLHARDIKGKGRYYGACGRDNCPFGDDLYISVTNAQGIVNKPALVPAAVKVTAEYAWQILPTMVTLSRSGADPNGCSKKRVAERCGACRFCLTAQMKAEHRNQWDYAADFGSAVHGAAYAENIGEPRGYDPDVEPFVQQYLRAMELLGVDLDRDIEAAETTILSRRHRYAGTGDIWTHLHLDPKTLQWNPAKRWLWLIDIKTSLKSPVDRVYGDQILQLAGLRFAEKAILADDTEVDVPKFAGTALLNLRSAGFALIPLPADKTAHAAFVHAVGLQTFMHGLETKSWRPVATPVLPNTTPTTSTSTIQKAS